jgi:peptidyl-prolyl cis-trans isomerase C
MRSSKNSPNKIIIIAVGVVVIAGAFFAFKTYNKANNGDTIVAHINGKPVYLAEANTQVQKISQGKEGVTFDALDEQSKLIIVKQIAANKIIAAEANKSDFAKKEEVKRKVAEFKDKVVVDEFLDSIAKSAITEEKIQARYDALVKELAGKTQYKARHILVKSPEAAEEIEKRLKDEPFEKVAKKESIDNQSAATGGDLGYLLSGSMVKEFEDVISKMNVGDVSAPVKTQFGWHIIKLEGKRPAEAAPLDKVRDAISKDLYNEAVQEHVKGILDKAEIEMATVSDKPEVKTGSSEVKKDEAAAKEVAPAPEKIEEKPAERPAAKEKKEVKKDKK